MSKNSLLKTGTISEIKVIATGLESKKPLSSYTGTQEFTQRARCSHLEIEDVQFLKLIVEICTIENGSRKHLIMLKKYLNLSKTKLNKTKIFSLVN